jgi:PAS domain S-box-containing protein
MGPPDDKSFAQTHRPELGEWSARVPDRSSASAPLLEADLWLVDSLIVPASLHDTEGRFIHMNPAAELASGNTTSQMIGHHFTEPLLPDARPIVEAHFERAVERGELTDFETVFVDARGHVRGVRAQHLPLRDRNAIVGVLILAYDVRHPRREPACVAAPPQLTFRQRQILDLVASGLSTPEIAHELTLSEATVRNHLAHLLSELDAHSRAEAIVVAQRLGLLSASPLAPQPSEHDMPGAGSPPS